MVTRGQKKLSLVAESLFFKSEQWGVTPIEGVDMPNTKGKSIPVATRISVEAHGIIERRIKKNPKWKTVGQYVREQIEFIVTRKHDKGVKE